MRSTHSRGRSAVARSRAAHRRRGGAAGRARALLENAVKYTEPEEPIELRAVARGNAVEIEVADGGCGIPEAAIGRIFERFARADDARTRELGGAGLGLAIVDAIARAHGGRCSAQAGRPRGTVFALRLPHFVPTRRSVADWAVAR